MNLHHRLSGPGCGYGLTALCTDYFFHVLQQANCTTTDTALLNAAIRHAGRRTRSCRATMPGLFSCCQPSTTG